MYNSITLIGRLGKDPEIKSTKSGSSFARLNVATNEWRKDGDDFQEITQWHQVVIWDERLVQKTAKAKMGSVVYLEGMVKYREYMKDGEKRFATDVEVPRFSGKFGIMPAGKAVPNDLGDSLPAEMAEVEAIPF